MSRNIKDIGKELLGKSLNSFHRKTGLTQLEENNEMQDGILNGILSQVDDAYIEKTEQSNVIHLDGSGDGVVVLDSIEGNTMVNLHPTDLKIGSGDGQDSSTVWYVGVNMDKTRIKPNTYYTVFVLNSSGKVDRCYFNLCRNTVLTLNENKSSLFYTDDYEKSISYIHFYSTESVPKSEVINTKIVVLEGDYTNCNINFFEGLQSSFEEKVNDEGKYEIEILINNKNLFNKDTVEKDKALVWASGIPFIEVYSNTSDFIRVNKGIYSLTNPNSTIQICAYDSNKNALGFFVDETTLIPLGNNGSVHLKKIQIKDDNIKYIRLGIRRVNSSTSVDLNKVQFEISETLTTVTPHKSNKIKLLLNSPLLKGDEIVYKEDGLYHYHKMKQNIFDGSEDENWSVFNNRFWINNNDIKVGGFVMSDKYATDTYRNLFYNNNNCIAIHDTNKQINIKDMNYSDVKSFKGNLKTNNVKIVGELAEPYYEKITNEYGEPIILEGYENGTIYIDSTIVPTTTVRYTPKMESFKTYKEVKAENAINDFDVTNNVIPYMMEVDMKLTELEISAYSTYNIKNTRKMEVLDMTSMQERTFNMLERLIRGKSHTKQEMIDRILLYEQAKRITTEQALELNLIIEEVYGA